MAARKVAAVIGYGPGIGHAVATKWSAEGFNVALVSRSAEKLEAACKTISNSTAYPCDATDTAALQACLSSIESSLGPVDHLLYNAGNGVWKKYDDINVEMLDQAMKINVYGLLTCTQALCPKMAARGGGFVCVTGATASLRGMPITAAFAAAKAAQRSLCQSIARQVWKENVHVCVNIIDASVGTSEKQMSPDSIASEYWHLSQQPKDCWSFQHHIQTSVSDMGLL
jgi:NADP-dependent 3-hydroxy acid dehydrogenase YdfG